MYIFESPRRLGPMKHESPGYLGHMKCYSPDIRESPGYSGPMKLESPGYSGPMKLESPGYSGPMKHKSPVYLRISGIFRPGPTKHKSFVYLLTFVAYEVQISGIFGASDAQTTCIFANLRDIWGQNHLYIYKSPDICKSP